MSIAVLAQPACEGDHLARPSDEIGEVAFEWVLALACGWVSRG